MLTSANLPDIKVAFPCPPNFRILVANPEEPVRALKQEPFFGDCVNQKTQAKQEPRKSNSEEVLTGLAESISSTPETGGGNPDVPEVVLQPIQAEEGDGNEPLSRVLQSQKRQKQPTKHSNAPILIIPNPRRHVSAEVPEVREENVPADTGVELEIVPFVEPQPGRGIGIEPTGAIRGEKVSWKRKTSQTAGGDRFLAGQCSSVGQRWKQIVQRRMTSPSRLVDGVMGDGKQVVSAWCGGDGLIAGDNG
ncbi:hypothetical protein Dimus_029625 [Dionaea muscipula]